MASQKEDNFIKNEQAQELHRLLAKYKKTQDKRARDKIVEQNFNLVKKIAHGLARRSTDPVDDLIQIGSIGLIKAIEYFNPDAGAKFTTYATHLITGEIRHYLRDKTSMIRAPRELQELSFRINKIVERLRGEFGRDPTDLEIAEVLQDVKQNKIHEAYEVDRRRTLVSLDQTLSSGSSAGENDTNLIDTLMDIKEHKKNDTREEFLIIEELIGKLKEPLAQIIDLIFFQDIPQAEVAQLLGISQMQVSRRLKKATSALQELINNANLQNSKQPIMEDFVETENGKRVSRSSLGAKLQAQKGSPNSL
ncbi:MAG: sigma-70 family RNA polymerase sigma factor [Candidatus Caenarcaniphilales bacterium]|jgi:RNA polymerase sigma-B factor|nr:sigma-70 family RNA polymerase sigma factor [Candidatus Caenarcaniphilales bacterium]